MKQTYHSYGKLLISGEYVVLDGATALSIPTKFGQELIVEPCEEPGIHWSSLDLNGNIWYQESFQISPGEIKSTDPSQSNELIRSLLQLAYQANPDFLSENNGYKCISSLEFPQNWGLGSSSTLIHNIAQWANVDPFQLSDNTLGGSGYDIAAAGHGLPLRYQNTPGNRKYTPLSLPWTFTGSLFFVHLNRKQNSRSGIRHYKELNKPEKKQQVISEISSITEKLITTNSINEFKKLLEQHEEFLSDLLGIPTIKAQLFPDFNGMIKSLGAWGGDFVMVSARGEDLDYFRTMGYDTIVPFDHMIA